MTTYTKAQLATRVLRDAGLLGADETASSADLDWVEETISSTFSALRRKNINIWDSSDNNLTEDYLVLLSQRIVLDIAPSFGLMTLAEAVTAKPVLEKELRTLSSQGPTGTVQNAVYY